uniref:Cytochrome c oxidase subunit 3 n=1 Tax=Polyacanthorhynchus caballeroi TaxID=178082 RepID=A0A140DJ82_9BILA|nr:cytochrome c oxidase subunit III [Polyacanthorhynchus caballeroi]AMK47836.1 cytochrome c oxidase subunit 3 [Polyacanthorhynchus caballeroi]
MLSVWPLMGAVGLFGVGVGMVYKSVVVVCLSVMVLLSVLGVWGVDGVFSMVDSESGFEGGTMPWGVGLFIFSELMIFVSVLGGSGYLGSGVSEVSGFSSMLSGPIEVDYAGVGLFASVLLLSSGVSLTWAHAALLVGDGRWFVVGESVSVVLGGVFVVLQYYEWSEMMFSWEWGSAGSMFFLATGLHGFHVLIGVLMNSLSSLVMGLWGMSWGSVEGVEAAMWYWHFVDLVWLGVFLVVYWYSL